MYKVLSHKKILFLIILTAFLISTGFLIKIANADFVFIVDSFFTSCPNCFNKGHFTSKSCFSTCGPFDDPMTCDILEVCLCYYESVDCCTDTNCSSLICNNYSCCDPVHTISCSVSGDNIEVCWTVTESCGRSMWVQRYDPSFKSLYGASSPTSGCEWDNNLSSGTYKYIALVGTGVNAVYAECTIAACDCTSWASGSCGGGTCPDSERQHTRSCDPSGCNDETKCESDPTCLKPDFDVISFSGPSTVEVNETFTYSSTVKNIGNAQPDSNSVIRYYADGTEKCGYGLWRSYMTPGGTEDTSCSSLRFTSAGNHTVKVCADPDNNIPEWNEGNNCESRTVTVTCRPHEYYQCSDNDVYWYNSCNIKEDKKLPDCGEDSCGSWSYYCTDNRYRRRTRDCRDRGCSGNSCYDTPYTVDEAVSDCCSGGTCTGWRGDYRCSGGWYQ